MKLSGIKNIALGLFLLIQTQLSFAQNFVINDPFKDHFFIENNGQYPDFQGKPVLFELTDKAYKIYILKDGFLWTKGYKDSQTQQNEVKISWIKNQFVGANLNSKLVVIGKTKHYYTHVSHSLKSFGYEKLIFKNFYPNIDLIYEFGKKGDGLKYSFKVHSGGDIKKIQFTYKSNDSFTIENTFSELHLKNPYFELKENELIVTKKQQKLEAQYEIQNNLISLNIPDFKIGDAITIDPWIKPFQNFLRQINFYSETFGENIGYEVDFDSRGNVYVYGGCPLDQNQLHLAKYDLSGNLVWISDGSIIIPTKLFTWYTTRWNSGLGNFIVDRTVDKINISEGWGSSWTGNIIIRLDTNGFSDTFTICHQALARITKFTFNCNPQRVVAYGGRSHKNYFAHLLEVLDTNISKPKAIVPNSYKKAQELVIYDAATDDSNNVFILGKAFSPPYTWTFWQDTNSYDVMGKLSDSLNGTKWYDTLKTKIPIQTLKPFVKGKYTNPGTIVGSSSNSLAVTKNYLFYYDGKYLGAYNKYNGKLIRIDSIPNKKQSFQQGIVADNCGNVIIGADSGRIKVYKFNGSSFQYIKKVVVYANSPRCILDLTYDKDRNVLVFSGDSMAGVISNPVSCEVSKTTEFYVYPNKRCSNFAFAHVKFPDTTKSYTFIWYDSTTNKIARKITKFNQFRDTFNSRIPSHSYLVTIKKEDGCFTQVSSFWLYVIPDYDTTFKIKLCQGNFFQHKKKYYTGDTTVIDTFTTYFGCDSLVRYQIKTYKHTSLFQDKFLCRGDTLWVGQYFHTQTGNFHDTFINSNGCDSVVHTNLKVFHDSIVQFKRICNGSSFSIGKHTYTKSGIYIDSFKNFFGCDSIVTTKLIISYDTLINLSFSICRGASIKVGLNVYTQTGIFTDSFKRLSGCDSVIVTRLKVNNDTTITNNITICQGDTITVGKHKYFQQDNYQDSLLRITGCDSVINTHLKVLKTNDTSNNYILCNRDSILIDGKFYNKTTTFKKTYKNSNGCDSTVTYNLKKNSVIANFDIDSTQNPFFVFKNLSQGITKFYWSFGDFSIDSVNKNTSHQYKNDQTYWATVCLKIIDSFGCNDTICQRIQISKLLYYLYNSFTPGSDGKNDVLKIGYIGGNFQYNLFIYNRWGALVFETQNANVTDESKFWNGKVMNNGADCPEGSYFALYQLYIDGPKNPPKQINGVITLIR